MASILQIENLSKSYGDRMLFSEISFGVAEGDKIGIIARNGTGKSTLLNIIAGKESPDSGKISFRSGIRIGYLEQTPVFNLEISAIDNIISTCPNHAELWDFEKKAKAMLGSFKIDNPSQITGTLSGGQLKRVAIARVLLSEPELLILDEPTNHLDIDIIEWLENYLSRQRMTLLMVTHDRYFLDNICTSIIEIDKASIFTYQGNYDYYIKRREERMENLSAELARVNNILRKEREWIRRQPQARGSKAKYRIDNFHQLEEKSRMKLNSREIILKASDTYIGSKIFEANNISKSFGDKNIINNWSYVFARHDKVGIVGSNGIGKSTFLKLLLGYLKPDSGNFDIGITVRWGYYSQEGIAFDENKKVIDAVRDIAEEIIIDDKTHLSASQFLSRFLFSPSDQQNYIYKLSGGEKRRLYLATVLMSNPNFIILDEPTNDLDIITLSILEDYLVQFKGCVIVVSHDRFFLNRIVNHLFVFTGNGEIIDFPGNYSIYRDNENNRQHNESTKTLIKKANWKDNEPPQRKNYNKLTFKEKQEMEELQTKLHEMEIEKNTIENEMSSGKMDATSLISAGNRIGILIREIDAVEMRLLELMDKESY